MRKFILGIICGAAIGGILLLFLYKSPPQILRSAQDDNSNEALEILDEAIDEFTQSTIEMPNLAGKSSKEELSDARVGYFPDTVRALAKLVQQQSGVPCQVTLAQFALESRFGLNNLGASNYFGHCFAATKQYMTIPSYVVRYDWVPINGILVRRQVRFADYKDITEAFIVHGKYLAGSEYYRDAFKWVKSPEKFARELAKHYAADKSYAMKLILIMRRYKL